MQSAVAYVGICGTDLHVKQGRMGRRVPIPAPIGMLIAMVATAKGTNVLISEPNRWFDLVFQALDFDTARTGALVMTSRSAGSSNVRYNV